MSDANDFLMQGGTPAAKFPVLGTTVIGMITKPPRMAQVTDPATGEVKRWQSGDAQMQVVIDLQTGESDPNILNDDGVRTLWAKGFMKNAIRDAVRQAGAPGLEVGGILQVTYSADGEQRNKAFRPPKLFTATYHRPQAEPVQIPDEPWQGQPQASVQQPVRSAQPAQQPVQATVAARPAAAPDPAVAASFMDRLRQQAANNKAAREQHVNHQGQFQDEEPPF